MRASRKPIQYPAERLKKLDAEGKRPKGSGWETGTVHTSESDARKYITAFDGSLHRFERWQDGAKSEIVFVHKPNKAQRKAFKREKNAARRRIARSEEKDHRRLP